MPLATLAEVFQFEKWLDEGVRDVLLTQSILQPQNYFTQLQQTTAITPRIEIFSIPGGVEAGRHTHILPDEKRTIFDTFDGGLQVTVKTNRGDRQGHWNLCGQVRAALNPISLRLGWQGAPTDPTAPIIWQSPCVTLTDIYLSGESLSSVDDQENLDVTMIPFALLFNVLDTAWPLNI